MKSVLKLWLKNIEEGSVFQKEGKVYWKCRNCGYIHEADAAPEVCPVCVHPQAFFEVESKNY